MTNITFRPIAAWPRAFSSTRKSAPFSATYSETLELLRRELRLIHTRNVVIQLALQDSDLRRDGLPYASSRPSHPGVILSFDKSEYSVSMPCDTFTSWEANLRAIALSLEALRKVDRYGVTQSDEQYRGWAQLPAASVITSRTEALAFLVQHGGLDAVVGLSDPALLQKAYRAAAKKLHPDMPTGSHELFLKLQAAVELLKKAKK